MHIDTRLPNGDGKLQGGAFRQCSAFPDGAAATVLPATTPPCYYLNNNYCKETDDKSSCEMDWEKHGTCQSAGFPVCCKGLYDIQLWYKPGTSCTKENPNLKPC